MQMKPATGRPFAAAGTQRRAASAHRLGRNTGRVARLAIVFLAGLSPVLGADAPKGGTVNLVVENDVFYDNDRDYTSGIAAIWIPKVDAPPDWALAIARSIPWFPQEGTPRHGYAIGQNMYTPGDITLADPPLNDRPYAGWLYATIALGLETERQLNQIALTVGMVGPASLVEQTQKWVHDITGSREPRGWHTQLRNEPGILLTYQRGWRMLLPTTPTGLAVDVTTHLGGAIGNVYTYANAGLTLRYGRNLRVDYGPPRIQPSAPGSKFFAPPDKYAWYLFAGIEGRAVARNIFLDGNTFHESRSVDKEPFIGDLHLGVTFTWQEVRVSYTHVALTREFKGQVGRSKFGAVSISISY